MNMIRRLRMLEERVNALEIALGKVANGNVSATIFELVDGDAQPTDEIEGA